MSKKAKEAILLGGICCISYLSVYVARNVLSTVSPQMIKEGIFDKEFVGTLSSVFFIAYALGQLINGIIGDRIKAKYMMSCGLLLAGVSNYAFSFVPATPFWSFFAYSICGFFLSMIYAPMTKVVAESLEPIHATRCGVCYTFAMFFGSPLAGMLAAYFSWQDVFAISGAALGIMAISCFSIFTLFEKKGIIKRINRVDIEKNSGSIRTLFEHKIVKFTLVAMITGVIRTTVIFWLPTYIEEYLGFPEKNALLIFSIATFMLSLAAFVALFVYEKLKRNIDNSILVFFIVSVIMFALVYFVKQPL
ncbi:MAG: MFS transporter, partial [Clostridia bacterium]|nr:MFS transporter [Clostridia bacterium]